MADKPEVVVFLNKATGLTWAVNPGTPAYGRIAAGVARGDYELVEQSKRRGRAKPDSDEN